MSSVIGKTTVFKQNYQTKSTNTNPDLTTSNSQFSPVTLSFCHQLRSDQLNVINYLNSGKDVFQLVSAGGGKTLPILCWWVTNCLKIDVIKLNQNKKDIFNILNFNHVPKLVWCVPTRQLTTDFVNRDFKYPLISLFQALIQTVLNSNNNAYIVNFLTSIGVKNAGNYANQIISVKQKFQQTNNPIYKQQLDSLLQNLNNEMLSRLKLMIDNYITMAMEGVTPNLNAPIIIGIYESIVSRIDKIKNNIGILVFDESHKMFPADITSFKDSDLEREINISNAVYKICKEISPKSRVTFLSGTVNPITATELLRILNVCFNRKFVLHSSHAKNQAKIRILKDDRLSDINHIITIAISSITHREWGNLFIFFSKKQILSICRQIVEKLTHTKFSPKENMYRMQKSNKSIKSQLIDNPEISQISDKFLRECLLKGFGYITSELTPNDRSIVSNLFANKKLSCLITTDSVEVGINLAVRNLYIPSIKVFRDNQFRELPLANLNQLLNRAGRSAIDFATIYTTSEYYDSIQTALTILPVDYEYVPILLPTKDFKDCKKKFILYYIRMNIIDRYISKIRQMTKPSKTIIKSLILKLKNAF